MKPVKPKRRRSSKRRPMTMDFVLRGLKEGGIQVRMDKPAYTALVPFVLAKDNRSRGSRIKDELLGPMNVMGMYRVEMRDVDERVHLDTVLKISVPKERVEDALKLLRRLHEM